MYYCVLTRADPVKGNTALLPVPMSRAWMRTACGENPNLKALLLKSSVQTCTRKKEATPPQGSRVTIQKIMQRKEVQGVTGICSVLTDQVQVSHMTG